MRHKPKETTRRDLGPSPRLTAFDRAVKEAIFTHPDGATREERSRPPRNAERIWAQYQQLATGPEKLELGKTLLDLHKPSQVMAREGRHQDSDRKETEDIFRQPVTEEEMLRPTMPENPLAGVAHDRRRPPDVPAGYLMTPGRGMIQASAGSEPSLRIHASNQELVAALALQELAASVIALREGGRGRDSERGRVLAAYEAAFCRPPPDHPPWLGVLVRTISAASRELLQLRATQTWSGTFAEERCFRPSQVKITPGAAGSTIEVLDPRGATLEVENRQIEEVRTKRYGATVLAELEGHASTATLQKFREAGAAGTEVVRALERDRLALRRRERDRDDDELEVVLGSEVTDNDRGVRLVIGPIVPRWQRVATEDAEPALWVRLTLEQALRSRQLTAPQVLAGIRGRLPRWSPLPDSLNDDDVVAWLLLKVGTGRGGGRTGRLSVGAIADLLVRPLNLAGAIERDAARKSVSPERREHLMNVAQRIHEREGRMFGPYPERPTPGWFPER